VWYNNNSEREIGWLKGSLKGISLGATTLVCRFGDYLTKNKSHQIHIERLVAMTFCVIAYETAEFEVVMGIWKGSQERAIHHARRRARWFEQDITAIRVVGVGLTNEEALALLHSASPLTDGVKVF
jgi:hypothetical protein